MFEEHASVLEAGITDLLTELSTTANAYMTKNIIPVLKRVAHAHTMYLPTLDSRTSGRSESVNNVRFHFCV